MELSFVGFGRIIFPTSHKKSPSNGVSKTEGWKLEVFNSWLTGAVSGSWSSQVPSQCGGGAGSRGFGGIRQGSMMSTS